MSDEWTVGGTDVVERLLGQVAQYASALRRSGRHAPDPQQVAAVLHALADYTALQQALGHRPEADRHDKAMSVGRWLHDVADRIERTPSPGDNEVSRKRRYAAEREATETPVVLTVTTRVPSKWLLVDRETGDRWEHRDGRWKRAGDQQ